MKKPLLIILPLGALVGLGAYALMRTPRQEQNAVKVGKRPSATRDAAPSQQTAPPQPTPELDVDKLLADLRAACKAGDGAAIQALVNEIGQLKTQGAVAVRDLMLGDPEGTRVKRRYWTSLVSVLKIASCPDASRALLAGFRAVEKHPKMPDTDASQLLGTWCPVIALSPSAEVVQDVRALLKTTVRRIVRQHLVKLAGMLCPYDPTLRDDIAMIMKGDASSEIRQEAAAALGRFDARASLADLSQSLSNALAGSTSYPRAELMAVVESYLKAVPLDEALLLLSDHVELARNQSNLTTIGIQIGVSYATGGVPDLEAVYVRMIGEQSPNKQILYLTAITPAALKGKDPRAYDIASMMLDSSATSWVQTSAMSCGIAHAGDDVRGRHLRQGADQGRQGRVGGDRLHGDVPQGTPRGFARRESVHRLPDRGQGGDAHQRHQAH